MIMKKYGINLPVGCWKEALPAIEKTGFRYLMLKWLNKLPETELDELREAIERSECEAFSLHTWEYLFLDTPFYYEKSLELTRSVIDMAKRFNARNITFHTPMVLDPQVNQIQRGKIFLNFLADIEELIAGSGIEISIENVWDEEADFRVPQELIPLLAQSELKHTGLCIDTGHLTVMGLDCGDSVRKLPLNLCQTTHIHDNDFLSDQHRLPGSGLINWSSFLEGMKKIQYENPYVLEVLSENTKTPEKDVAEAWERWQEIETNGDINIEMRQSIPPEKAAVNAAIRLYSDNEVPRAIKAFQDIKNGNSTITQKAQACGWLGRCYEKSDELSLAMECYRNMLKLDKTSFADSDGSFYIPAKIASYRIAEILFRQGNYVDALEHYAEITKVFPETNHEKWSLMKMAFICQEKLNDKASAMKHWREFERVNNNAIFCSLISYSIENLTKELS